MDDNRALPSPGQRAFISFIVPLVGAVIVNLLSSFSGREPSVRASTSIFLATIGLLSLLLGLRWYRIGGLGLRGGRPLYAGIGFATLGWLAYWIARVALVSSNPDLIVAPQSGSIFIYLLLFEAFATQLWTFGLLFRSLAEWRGPLTAAIMSGLVFGAVASQLFEEAFVETPSSLLYFMVWGVFYGLIRLRTGSIVGIVLIQAIQALTTWFILLPEAVPRLSQYNTLYLVTVMFYLIFIWRLWPREEEDYRV